MDLANNTPKPIGEKAELHSRYRQKRGNFQPLSLKHHAFLFLCMKYELSKQLLKIFVKLCGSSSIFALSNHTTLS
jgi:hypothetical protein